MADEQKKIEYVYEGDVSSLLDATNDAIQLLTKYQSAAKRAASEGRMDIGKTTFKGFQKSVNNVIKQVNDLAKTLDASSADVKKSMSSEAAAVVKANKDIADSLEFLDSASTAEDFKLITATLKDASSQIQTVANKARGLSSSFVEVGPQISNAASATDQAATSMGNSGKSMQQTFKSTASEYDKMAAAFQAKRYAEQFAADSQRVTKSALDSAKAFVNLGKAGAQVNSVSRFGNVMGKVVYVFNQARAQASIMGGEIQRAFSKITAAVNPVVSKMQAFKDKAAQALQSVQKRLAPLAAAFRRTTKETDSSDASIKKLTRSTKQYSQQIDSTTPKVRNLGNSMKELSNSTGLVSRMLGALTGIQLGRWFADSAKSAISYVENLNLFTVAMGDSVERGKEFVATMQEVYGMDPSNLYRYAGYFYQLTGAIGMSDEAAATLSLSMTKAANDIASLFNVDINTVVENLASGMQGMSRAVRKYGMDIRSTTLQQTALKYGLTEQVETMSEANRMALRYLTMMEQVRNATQQVATSVDGTSTVMGDFARTIESPANQLRIFKEQMSQLGRAIGTYIVYPFSKAIAYINGFVMALRMALNFVASFFGILSTSTTDIADTVDDVEGVASSVGSVGSAAKEAAKEVQNLLSPLDELNILKDQSSSSGGGGGSADVGSIGASDVLDPALADAISDMELQLENVRMKANEVRDAILEFFGFKVDAGEIISWDADQFEANLIEKFPQWTKTIQAVFDNWTDIVNGFKNVLDALGGVLLNVAGKVKTFLGYFINDDTVSVFVENIAGALDTLASWINQNQEPLATLGATIIGIVTGFSAFNQIVGVVTIIQGLVASLGALVGLPTLLIAGFVLLATQSESFATSLVEFFTAVFNGLSEIGTAAWDLLVAIGEGLAQLWSENVQPMVEALGEALAPVLDTLATLWQEASNIIVDAINLIQRVWTNTLVPVFAAIADGVTSLAKVFQAWWTEAVGPIVELIAEGLTNLWVNAISPIVERILSIVGELIELIMALWNNVLAPLLSWAASAFGPSLVGVFKTIWTGVQSVIVSISGIINGLLTILEGLLEFLTGVFTGNWSKAWNGILKIVAGVLNTLISAFELAINAIITVFNSLFSTIVNALRGLANMVLGAIEDLADLVGIDVNLRITGNVPQIPQLRLPRVPMATGGVVSSPTNALIGEGKYSEAVIPLEDSPQMQDLIDKIAAAVDKDNDDKPIEVHVYLDGKEITSSQNRTNKKYGKTQQQV